MLYQTKRGKVFFIAIIFALLCNVNAYAYQISVSKNGLVLLSDFINSTITGRTDTVLVQKETTHSDSVYAIAPISLTTDSITFYSMPSGHSQTGTNPVKIFLFIKFKRIKQDFIVEQKLLA